jgi:hypothetical protein
MKYLVPVVVGAAVMTAAITTAIAQSQHAYPFAFPYLYGYGFAMLFLVMATVIAMISSRLEQSAPHIVATRYGQASQGTGINSRSYQVGESGLVIANHGEPAYEIGVYLPFAESGPLRLHFSNRITHLKTDDGESQISTWIDSDKSGFSGNGLFEVMRQFDINRVSIPISYKDIKNRWYRTVCTIDRNVLLARDGLVVKSNFRGRTRKPKT